MGSGVPVAHHRGLQSVLNDRFIAHTKPCLLLEGGTQQANDRFRDINAPPPRHDIKQLPKRVGADAESIDIPCNARFWTITASAGSSPIYALQSPRLSRCTGMVVSGVSPKASASKCRSSSPIGVRLTVDSVHPCLAHKPTLVSWTQRIGLLASSSAPLICE